jgi:hypothetical protein
MLCWLVFASKAQHSTTLHICLKQSMLPTFPVGSRHSCTEDKVVIRSVTSLQLVSSLYHIFKCI